MNHIENLLWEEKYRPKQIDDLILPSRVTKKIENGLYTHMLFHGSPGSGKTSTAKVLADGHPYLYINCSVESGKDTVKTKITDFASGFSLIDGEKKTKVIILDEFDGVSLDYFKAMRGTMEQFHKTTRFVATCNYFNKIPSEIQSRFECINFDFEQDEISEVEKLYMKRVYKICINEGMTIEKDAMVELVRRKFPDLRATIKALQGYHAEGVSNITLDTVVKFHGVYKDVFKLIFSDTNAPGIYKEMGAYSNKVDDLIKTLGTDFIDYIETEQPNSVSKLPTIANEVNQHSYQSRFVIDPYVCLLSLVYKLNKIVNS